jgi:hypothetical protein
MIRVDRRPVGVVTVLLGALVGALLGFAPSSQPGVAATDRLQAAQFPVLTPRLLPAGTELINSEVRPHADGTGDVDLWYRLPDGHQLHLWETSRADSALANKNPLQLSGARRAGALATWLQGTGFSSRVVTWTARIGPVLVSVDAALSPDALFVIADSLR